MTPFTSVLEFRNLKRTRRYGAKVKTGCRTCKARHIKCDEGKPECARCTNAGRKCDGYAQDTSSQAFIRSQSSSLPNHLCSPQKAVSILHDIGDSTLYLEFYYYAAIPALATNFDREFWSRIALQVAHSELAVRHAVIALGYLVKTESGSLKQARLKHSSSALTADKTFLVHYNKAVQNLRASMNEASFSLEVGLVTCLLFICIEFLKGDHHVAIMHLYNGFKMLEEWKHSHTLDSLPSNPPSATAIVADMIGPHVICGNLLPMFTRTLTTGILFGAPFEPLLERFCPYPQDLKTCTFSSISEAESALYEIRNPIVIIISIIFRKLSSGSQPSSEDMRQSFHLITWCESWLRNLQDLERHQSLSRENIVTISSLKVCYYMVYIALACAPDIYQNAFDAHISDFKALNHHASIVLQSMDLHKFSSATAYPNASSILTSSSIGGTVPILPSNNSRPAAAAHFTFENSVIFPLYFVATRCRCPNTRREAISFLELNPPREGPLDAEQHAVVAKRVVELEESRCDSSTGWPVQETRIVSPVFNGSEIDENGGFWASFTSVAWILRGRHPSDPLRRRGDRKTQHVWGEWDEWLRT